MKGLTPQQLVEITEFIQKHHKFGWIPEEDRINGEIGYCIKYIDACYDSIQGDYWAITFRGDGSVCFRTNMGLSSDTKALRMPFSTLYDWIMAFLKYEWKQDPKLYGWRIGPNTEPLHNSFPNGFIEREFSDLNMIEAYCADLEDRNTGDTADACKWIADYREKMQKQK